MLVFARRVLVGVCLLLGTAQASERVKVRFATDWKAQAEHGGFYQAKALGLYAQAGLDVEIVQGGAGVNIPQLLGARAIDFGMGSNSFIPLNMVQAGVPAKAVMAAFQKDPQVLITHPRPDIKSIADMKGKPIMISDATISGFWLWLRAEYGFSNRQIRKYTFNLAPFLVDRTAIQQGYVSAEPFNIARQTGAPPQVFLLSDYGYPSYAAMVLARNDWILQKPELVRAFVDASRAGWRAYIYGDPSAANALIKRANPEMSDANIAYAISEIRARGIVKPKTMPAEAIGAMETKRWRAFFDIMAANGIYPPTLDWRAAFTTRFVREANE